MPQKLIFCLMISISTFLFSQGQNLDRFGGSKNLHFEGLNNDFFATVYHEGHWWFVTPEQNAFLSFGLNHFHAYLWAQDYNKEHWEDEFGGTAWSEPWKDGFYGHAKEVSGKIGANQWVITTKRSLFRTEAPFCPIYVIMYR